MARASRLLSLPRGIRNDILENAVINESPIHLRSRRRHTSRVKGRLFVSKSGLIWTCTQLHDEYFDILEGVVLASDNYIKISAPLNPAESDDTGRLGRFGFKLTHIDVNTIKIRSKLEVKLLVEDRCTLTPRGIDVLLQGRFDCCRRRGMRATYKIDKQSGELKHYNWDASRDLITDLASSNHYPEPESEQFKVYMALLKWDVRRLQCRVKDMKPIVAGMRAEERAWKAWAGAAGTAITSAPSLRAKVAPWALVRQMSKGRGGVESPSEEAAERCRGTQDAEDGKGSQGGLKYAFITQRQLLIDGL